MHGAPPNAELRGHTEPPESRDQAPRPDQMRLPSQSVTKAA